jgi:predicted metal-dependent TIM-barrel fold hydrolase
LAFFVQQTLSVSEFSIFTTDNIPQLLETLTADVEALGSIGLGRIVAEEDECFKCGGRI